MTGSANYHFDVDFYRAQNRDLNDQGLTDEELTMHFERQGHNESRPFAKSEYKSVEMSMKWLRGKGLEIGAGKSPTPVFGSSTIELGELDPDFAFGGDRAQHWIDIGGAAPEDLRERFDFSICSHVLEHCDSLLRGIVNTLDVVKTNGIAYIILPDKRYLGDQFFIDDFDLEHHIIEYEEPLAYAEIHDQAYMKFAPVDEYANEHATLSSEYRDQIRVGRISEKYRFMHHKHNYSFGNWLAVMNGLQRHTGYFEIEDCCFGKDRLDCHFILRKSSQHKPTPAIISSIL